MAWIPLYSREKTAREGTQPEVGAGPARVILATRHAGSQAADLRILHSCESIEGLVVSTSADQILDAELRSQLQRSYPDLDLASCLLFEEIRDHRALETAQREAYFVAVTMGGVGLGAVSLVVGLFLWNLDRKRSSAKGQGSAVEGKSD
jgi:hypothetical protein